MTQPTTVCCVCHKTPNTHNNVLWECSHADCPHRRKAWSERPEPHIYDKDTPHPLDTLFDKPE